jgi:hypothetical protein
MSDLSWKVGGYTSVAYLPPLTLITWRSQDNQWLWMIVGAFNQILRHGHSPDEETARQTAQEHAGATKP